MPSRQRKYGGGKFKSERQRRFMWATRPKAAKKWAHNRKTRKSDWRRGRLQVPKGNRIRGAGERLKNGKFAGKRARGRTRKVNR